MRAFPAKSQLGTLAVEFRAPLNQFFYALRSFFDENLGSLRIAKTVTRVESVLEMKANFIFIAEGRSNAALGPLGVGVGDFPFRQNYNPASRRKVDSCTQSGYAGPNNE